MERRNYNEAPAYFHNDVNVELVTVHDIMPGKHGYTHVIKTNGYGEFVENYDLTYGEHDIKTCERCNPEE